MTLGVVVVGGKCLASPFEGEDQVPLRGQQRKRGEEWGDKSVVPSPFQYPVAPSVPSFQYPVAPSGYQVLAKQE